MNVHVLASIVELNRADQIFIPYVVGQQKKLIRYIESVQAKSKADWQAQALSLIKHHKAEHKRCIEQWIGSQRLILMGLDTSLPYHQVSALARTAIHKVIEKDKQLTTALVVPDYLEDNCVAALTNGMRLANMRIDYFKLERAENQSIQQIILEGKKQSTFKAIAAGLALAEVQEQICQLVNLPSNEKNPAYIVQWAKERFTHRSMRIEVLDQEGLKQHGLNALLTVGQGSKTPPYLLVIQYKPKSKGKLKHLGLIGKGVTFDTGGISLKDPLNMHLMKSDMGGAAAVLGTMDIIGRLNLPIQATAVIPLAENAIGPDAYRPGDVISSYNGKSIEVIDTDAEGRLILADAISFMIKNHRPDILIDLATLTGSIIMTLGFKAAGLFTNNEALAKSIKASADTCGERVWRLPLWDEYQDEMNSDIADIKNLANKPVAGAITAAKFLQAFTEDHPAWAHLDIAGVAMTDSEFSKQRSATAYGVLLLKQWIEDLIQ